MDLNRLENWSRRVLEREAKRIGISDPSALSLLDLVTSILHARTESQESDGRARRALQTALFVFENLVRMAEVAIPTRNQPTARSRYEPTSRPPKHPSVSPHQQKLHFDSEAPAVAAVDKCEEKSKAETVVLESIESPKIIHSAVENQPPPPAPDQISTTRTDPSTVLIQWNLSDSAIEHARRIRKLSGSLTARAIIVKPDIEQVTRTETRDHPHIASQGEWTLRDLPEESRVIVSIGLAEATRFISISHTPIVN